MQRERHLIRMSRAPRYDSLQLVGIVWDRADFEQFRLDDFGLSHIPKDGIAMR